jgi:hypothetical protein
MKAHNSYWVESDGASSALMKGFPSTASPMISEALRIIGRPVTVLTGAYQLVVCGESLVIPYRAHFDLKKGEIFESQMRENTVLTCILSRHSEGKLRQRAVRALLATPNVCWVIPYVVALVGEYVIEVLVDIEKSVDQLDPAEYGLMLRNNADYVATLEQKIISYWNCYYRREFPVFKDYVGSRLIERFKKLAISNSSTPVATASAR